MVSVSRSIFQRTQRKSEFPGAEKWEMRSASVDMDVHVLYSSSTFCFSCGLFSFGPGFSCEGY